MNFFLSYEWPGNVRELENVVKKIVVLENQEFALSDLGMTHGLTPDRTTSESTVTARISLKRVGKLAAQEAEKQLILGTLLETRWNRKKAAQLLDISYKALLYKIKQSGLSKKRIPLQ